MDEKIQQLLTEAETYYNSGDMQLAFENFLSAALKGSGEASYRLGMFYEKGIYVQRDFKAALQWYFTAAKKGNIEAKERLAKGMPKTEKEPKEDADETIDPKATSDKSMPTITSVSNTTSDNTTSATQSENTSAEAPTTHTENTTNEDNVVESIIDDTTSTIDIVTPPAITPEPTTVSSPVDKSKNSSWLKKTLSHCLFILAEIVFLIIFAVTVNRYWKDIKFDVDFSIFIINPILFFLSGYILLITQKQKLGFWFIMSVPLTIIIWGIVGKGYFLDELCHDPWWQHYGAISLLQSAPAIICMVVCFFMHILPALITFVLIMKNGISAWSKLNTEKNIHTIILKCIAIMFWASFLILAVKHYKESTKFTINIDMLFFTDNIIEFQMGNTPEQFSGKYSKMEEPVHTVKIKGFGIGRYEVTQWEWERVMGYNPSHFKGDYLPVENVSWNEVQEFIKKLNEKTGKKYRLPTEAEWELAARWNKEEGIINYKKYKYSGSNDLDRVGWYKDNSDNQTHRRGSKIPNGAIIYDMSGNVCEWCQDIYEPYKAGSVENPTGGSSGSTRIIRGGCWSFDADACRISKRYNNTPDYKSNRTGFRLATDENYNEYYGNSRK